jgi:hypothetical protein
MLKMSRRHVCLCVSGFKGAVASKAICTCIKLTFRVHISTRYNIKICMHRPTYKFVTVRLGIELKNYYCTRTVGQQVTQIADVRL